MSYRLGGRNSLPYLGVEAPTPPNTVIVNRSPTINDNANFNLGTFWLVPKFQSNPEELWVLVNLDAGIATWVQLYPTGGGGASEFIEDVGIANSLGGVINVIGGPGTGGYININTLGSGNTVEIKLNDYIQWPDSVAGLTEGAIWLGNSPFMHNLGVDSTFLGPHAGPSTNSSDGNTGIGTLSLNDITTGTNNTGLGRSAGSTISSGNTNLLLGYLAGSNYTTEDNNICIANNGTIADAGVIRIGNSAFQTSAYLAGTYLTDITTNSPKMVLQNNTDLLGTATITSTDGSIAVTYGAGTVDFAVTGVDTNKPAFLATQATAAAGVIGGGGTYVMGTSQAMVTIYDDTSSFYVGNGSGTPARFTAPTTGKYFLNFVASASYSGSITTSWIMNIITPARTYTYQCFPANTSTVKSSGFSTIADMSAGDTATFSISISASATGSIAGDGVVPGGLTNPRTFITGFLIA